MNDMRELLSNALPEPDDEPHQRDVIDSAMEWGDKRRRRDWALTGAAALAVVAVGAGVAALGTGSGSGRDAPAASGGGQQAGQTDPLGVQSNGAPFPTASPTCMPPSSVPPNQLDRYCDLWRQETGWMVEFAKGSVPYIRAALPQGYTVKATDSYVVQLTGPDGKTNILFPSATSAKMLEGHTPGCAQLGSDCAATSIGGGHGVVGQFPSDGQSAEWVADGLKDPVVLMGVNIVGTDGVGGLPAPTGKALLNANDLERIVSNPDFVQYSKREWERSVEIQKEMQNLVGAAAGSSESGPASSAPSGPPSGSASSAPSWPTTRSPASAPSWTPSS